MVERVDPRISLNQLTAYMTATPVRRHRIIYGQKYPPTVAVIYYDAATQAITDFLTSPDRDERLLEREIDRLESLTPRSDFDVGRVQSNVEAIETFLDLHDQIPLAGMTARSGESDPEQLVLGGVSVSVRPEVVLRGRRRDETFVGAIKLYFAKGAPLTPAAAAYGTTVLREYAAARIAKHSEAVRPSACLLVDVFAETVHRAPTAATQRMKNVAAACAEIAALWSTMD